MLDSKRNNPKELPFVSIIIPTLNSERFISMCLKACFAQKYPKDCFEVILADNYSKDKTAEIAKSLGAKVCLQKGKAPQSCAQRNLGARNAKGDYLYFLDHDMEMSPDLLATFAKGVEKTGDEIDAWFVPERIKASSWLLEKIRNFERSSYDQTIIDSARIIKKETFYKTEEYDLNMQMGPADWDMDNQLRELNVKWGIVDSFVYHHEEGMSFWQYIKKKSAYVHGCITYQDKWEKRNKDFFLEIIKRQFNPMYRLFGVFFEGKNWKKTLVSFPLYICLFFVRFLVGVAYLFKGVAYRLSVTKSVNS